MQFRGKGEVDWSVAAVTNDKRLVDHTSVPRNFPEEQKIPLPFKRVATALLVSGKGGHVIAGGRDAILTAWDVSLPADNGILRLPKVAGPDPKVAFDCLRPAILWALDKRGELRVLDSKSGRVLDHRKAHASGAADIALAHNNEPWIVTAGGDKVLRFWRLSDSRIVEEHLPEIKLGRPLLGVAVSPDNQFVACVDDEGLVQVCSVPTGARIFAYKTECQKPTRPLTGRVAFSGELDRTLLAAFGEGQSCHIFTTAPFAGPIDQARLGGNGGTAMLWSPWTQGRSWPRTIIRAMRFVVSVLIRAESTKRGLNVPRRPASPWPQRTTIAVSCCWRKMVAWFSSTRTT